MQHTAVVAGFSRQFGTSVDELVDLLHPERLTELHGDTAFVDGIATGKRDLLTVFGAWEDRSIPLVTYMPRRLFAHLAPDRCHETDDQGIMIPLEDFMQMFETASTFSPPPDSLERWSTDPFAPGSHWRELFARLIRPLRPTN